MAVYKIFAEKDTTLYSDYKTMNTGLDPILELTKNISLVYASQSSAARILIKFSDNDITDVKNSYIGTGSYKAYLKMYMADSTGLPVDYTLEARPIYGSWDMGTGQFGDNPITTDGTSWQYRTIANNTAWTTNSFPGGVTGSFTTLNPGGGNWYTSSVSTQSFGVYTDKDVSLDVSTMIASYLTGSLINNGFLIKTSGSLEFDPDYTYKLNFFSRDTNTIYPPVLEFRWDDSNYNVSGSTATLTNSQDIRVSISNNKGEFNEDEIYRFRLNVRDQYPVRTFATSSLFTVAKYLPSSSYYAIKDAKSDTVVVDFDTSYTKISADTQGNYFDVYMNGLEPERYYKLLVKTVISGSTLVFDNEYFFKVLE
jgi:hypothetical protein